MTFYYELRDDSGVVIERRASEIKLDVGPEAPGDHAHLVLVDEPLDSAIASQLATLTAACAAAVAAPVNFTTAGKVTKTFQADPSSVANLQATLAGLSSAQATPAGFYWVSADNTPVPFTYADLQGLAAAMLAQGWVAFQHLQAQKAAVKAATTTAAVTAVVW